MMKSIAPIFLAIIVVGCERTPDNFAECVDFKVKSAKTETAARASLSLCHSQFPEKQTSIVAAPAPAPASNSKNTAPKPSDVISFTPDPPSVCDIVAIDGKPVTPPAHCAKESRRP